MAISYNERMLKYILIALAFACAWLFWGRARQQAVQKQLGQKSAQYGRNLQDDVRRAQAAADAANKRIQQDLQELSRGIKQAEGR